MTVSEFMQSWDNQHKRMGRNQHLLYVQCVCVCVCVCVFVCMCVLVHISLVPRPSQVLIICSMQKWRGREGLAHFISCE